MTDYHFLESIDSVASPWGDAGLHPDDMAAAKHVQIFCEILMTLILGRAVVVPQSYAFDSWGFLKVASAILSAREPRGPRDRPFRLHLFGADTFDQAITDMLGRVSSLDRPFVSSLLPELRNAATTGIAIPATVEALLQSAWLGDRRAEALRIVGDEFRGLPRVPARPVPDALTLPEALASFVASPFSSPAGVDPAMAREVHDKLVRALRRLDISNPAPFLTRSRLRVSEPWPNDLQKRTPEAVAGGADVLGVVIEFVDTIYNAVVAASIGIATVTFTTGLARGGDSLVARAIAQSFALEMVASGCSTNPPNPARTSGALATEPLFQVSAGTRQALSGEAAAIEMRKLLARASGEGVSELLAQRAATGDDGKARSRFWVSLDKYRGAAANGNLAAAERAMDDHLKVVARILGRGFDAGLTARPLPQLLLSAASGGGGTVATATWQLPILATGAVSGISAAASIAVPLVITGFRGWHRRRRIFYALGTVRDQFR